MSGTLKTLTTKLVADTDDFMRKMGSAGGLVDQFGQRINTASPALDNMGQKGKAAALHLSSMSAIARLAGNNIGGLTGELIHGSRAFAELTEHMKGAVATGQGGVAGMFKNLAAMLKGTAGTALLAGAAIGILVHDFNKLLEPYEKAAAADEHWGQVADERTKSLRTQTESMIGLTRAGDDALAQLAAFQKGGESGLQKEKDREEVLKRVRVELEKQYPAAKAATDANLKLYGEYDKLAGAANRAVAATRSLSAAQKAQEDAARIAKEQAEEDEQWRAKFDKAGAGMSQLQVILAMKKQAEELNKEWAEWRKQFDEPAGMSQLQVIMQMSKLRFNAIADEGRQELEWIERNRQARKEAHDQEMQQLRQMAGQALSAVGSNNQGSGWGMMASAVGGGITGGAGGWVNGLISGYNGLREASKQAWDEFHARVDAWVASLDDWSASLDDSIGGSFANSLRDIQEQSAAAQAELDALIAKSRENLDANKKHAKEAGAYTLLSSEQASAQERLNAITEKAIKLLEQKRANDEREFEQDLRIQTLRLRGANDEAASAELQLRYFALLAEAKDKAFGPDAIAAIERWYQQMQYAQHVIADLDARGRDATGQNKGKGDVPLFGELDSSFNAKKGTGLPVLLPEDARGGSSDSSSGSGAALTSVSRRLATATIEEESRVIGLLATILGVGRQQLGELRGIRRRGPVFEDVVNDVGTSDYLGGNAVVV